MSRPSQFRFRRLALLVAILAVLVGYAGTGRAALQIIGLDVGQGDCTLIVSPTGKTVLIDAGDTGKGTGVVLPYLQAHGIKGLDYTVASHYHADHIGGMDEVVNALGRDSLRVAAYDRGWNYTTTAYTQYVTAVGAKRQTIADGQIIDLGDGVTLKCVAVNSNGILSAPYNNGRYDENNLCVALLLKYGQFDMLLGGDLPGQNSGDYHDIETSLAPEVGDVDVYKVHHHGSATSSNNTLLSTIKPEASLIYVGNGNSYGHPTQATINRLVSANSYIYQTELGAGGTIPTGHGKVANGNIVITVVAGSYTINGDFYSLGSAGVTPTYSPVFLSVYPNPFMDQATMHFNLTELGPVAIKIFDVEGRLVNILRSSAGTSVLTWDGTSLNKQEVPPGVYFIKLAGPSETLSEKLVKR